MTETLGRVEEIRVYPVKSMAGSSLPAADVGPGGLAGDRTHAVVAAGSGALVRSKDLPGMRDLAARGNPATDAAALTALAGFSVRVEPRPAGPSDAAVHLVSRQALARAAAGEVPEGCTADDPRANLVLSLPSGGDERGWVGRRLRIGTAVLEVTRLPKHCLGVYADVVRPGALAVGDPVSAEPAAAG